MQRIVRKRLEILGTIVFLERRHAPGIVRDVC